MAGTDLSTLGLVPEALIGRSAFDMYRGESAFLGDLRRALAGEAFASTVEMRGASLGCRYEPLVDGGGAVMGAVGIAVGLDERGQTGAHAAVAERETRREGFGSPDGLPRWKEWWFGELIENSPDLVILSWPDGRIRYVNPTVERLLGYRHEEFVALAGDLDELTGKIIHPEDRAFAAEELVGTAGEPGPRGVVAVRVRHKDGSWRHFEGYVNNLSDNPNVGGFVFVSRDVTKRVRAEEEIGRLNQHLEATVEERTAHLRATVEELAEKGRMLEESEERYRELVENVREGIGLIDIEGFIVEYCNGAYAEVLGLSPKELVGRSFLDFVDEGQREEALRQRDLRLEGVGSAYELTVTAADGKKKVLSCSGYPVFCQDGSCQQSVQTIVDVTQRKRAEEDLRRQADLLDLSHEPIFAWKLRGGIVHWNRGSEELYGFSKEEAVGSVSHRLLGTVHPVPLEQVENELERHGWWAGELEHTARDGRRVVVESRQQLARTSDGRRLVLETNRDVTERKRSEEALKESEERFRRTFQAAAVGMAHIAPNGSWMRVNDKLSEIVGYGREELSGLTFQDITHPEDLDLDLRHVRRMLAGEISEYFIEKRYIRKDRSRVWIELTVSLVRNPKGDPDYFISVVEDITERKLRELVPDPLTSREMEVLGRMAAGLNNPQIAKNLAYSLGTVKLCVRCILSKLGEEDRVASVARAIEIGLIPPSS